MIKDRAQKAAALRLCVSKRWLPQLEVEVEPTLRLEKAKSLLTDVDVLAVVPGSITGHNRIAFDCKSGSRESAIGRAFWLKGVMTRVSAMHGFVVMNEKFRILQDHRGSAADLGITLLRETEFEDLVRCIGGSTQNIDSAITNLDAWDFLIDLPRKLSTAKEYFEFSRSGYWMIKDPGEQCRKTVAKLRGIRTELDPSKTDHLAAFGDALCLFIAALSNLTSKLYLVLVSPSSKEEFSSSLLAMLYGGYDSLEAAQKIRRVTAAIAADESSSIFPELPRFEQLVRELMQSPQQSLPAALLAREMGFQAFLGSSPSRLLNELREEAPYAPKFVLLASEYLQKAAKLPPEFATYFGDASMRLMAGTRIESASADLLL